MKWVLIYWMCTGCGYHYSASFPDFQTCQAAADQMNARSHWYDNNPTAVCVPAEKMEEK